MSNLEERSRILSMKGPQLHPVSIKDLIPCGRGIAVFLEAAKKTFVIQVDVNIGLNISMCFMNKKTDRPLTHELMKNIFVGFGIEMTNAIIVDMHDDTFTAQLNLHQSNELGSKIVEVDARPSDCILLALLLNKPIFILNCLLERLDDVTELYNEIKKKKNNEFPPL